MSASASAKRRALSMKPSATMETPKGTPSLRIRLAMFGV